MTRYLSALSNRGGGVGHQFVNWNSCYMLAQKYGLTFLHQPFQRYEEWISFGDGERKYRAGEFPEIRVPKMDMDKPENWEVLDKIVESCPDETCIYLETDFNIRGQLKTQQIMKEKYWKRNPDRSYENKFVAVHVRRGMIVKWIESWGSIRFMPNDYYVKILKQLPEEYEKHVYSMASPEDMSEFNELPNTFLHLNPDEENNDEKTRAAFHAFASADIFVMGKSGMSNVAAIVSNGVKLAPPPGPFIDEQGGDKWIECNANSEFDTEKLYRALQSEGGIQGG